MSALFRYDTYPDLVHEVRTRGLFSVPEPSPAPMIVVQNGSVVRGGGTHQWFRLPTESRV